MNDYLYVYLYKYDWLIGWFIIEAYLLFVGRPRAGGSNGKAKNKYYLAMSSELGAAKTFDNLWCEILTVSL